MVSQTPEVEGTHSCPDVKGVKDVQSRGFREGDTGNSDTRVLRNVTRVLKRALLKRQRIKRFSGTSITNWQPLPSICGQSPPALPDGIQRSSTSRVINGPCIIHESSMKTYLISLSDLSFSFPPKWSTVSCFVVVTEN